MPEPIQADLSGKICVITGASAGIGKAVAGELARLGARLVMAVRDPARGESARRQVLGATGSSTVELAVVDFSSQRSIRAFARDLAQRLPRIDVLVNNAGIWANRRQQSTDGIELTWATNVLGYFLVTQALQPLLEQADKARVVNVASQLAGGLDLGDVELERRPYNGRTAYAQSKQADRMLSWAQARRFAHRGRGVTANALHPGFVATEIFSKGGGLVGLAASFYAKLRAKRPSQGADTVVYLAASPEAAGRSGLFWVERQERHCRFRGEAAEEALYALCERMTAGSRA